MVRKIALHIVLPLAIGGLFYLLFYSTNTPLWSAFAALFGAENLMALRPNWQIPNRILHHLPDGLWAYAMTASFLLLKEHFGLLILALLATLTYEIAQFYDWIKGTFDYWDIGVMWLFCGMAFYILHTSQKKYACCIKSL